MHSHNPKLTIQQLQTILSSPTKKIWFLFWAGISMKKVDNTELIVWMDDEVKDWKVLKEWMTSLSIKDLWEKHKQAVEKIKDEILRNWRKFNIETLLSKISEKERAVWEEKLCWLSKEELNDLRNLIEKKIIEQVSVHLETNLNIDITQTNQLSFSRWIKNANRKFPVEIFTTNYDYLLELALEKTDIPYFDGFVWSYEAFFCPEWIEDDSPISEWVKLWKLHGSLGWTQNQENEVIRTSWTTWKAMIFPSFLKYDHSKKQPYLSYMDRLSYFIKKEDSVLFICGYSFWDDHINEIITTSLWRSNSHVFILKNWDLSDESDDLVKLAKSNTKLSVLWKRYAVIWWKYGQWQLDRQPDTNESYNIIDFVFSEDAVDEKSPWLWKGSFILWDFKKFTEFLSNFYNVFHE